MQTVTIDLTKEPEIAADVSDKEPGDAVKLRTSIKSNDGKTLVLTIEEASSSRRDDEEANEDLEEDAEEEYDEYD